MLRVMRRGAGTVAEIAKDAGIPRGWVAAALWDLRAEGKATRRKDGRAWRYRLLGQ